MINYEQWLKSPEIKAYLLPILGKATYKKLIANLIKALSSNSIPLIISATPGWEDGHPGSAIAFDLKHQTLYLIKDDDAWEEVAIVH